MIAELLPRVLPAITEGLRDLDDDVRAVAAASLIPVVDGLVQSQPAKVCAQSSFVFDSQCRYIREHILLSDANNLKIVKYRPDDLSLCMKSIFQHIQVSLTSSTYSQQYLWVNGCIFIIPVCVD